MGVLKLLLAPGSLALLALALVIAALAMRRRGRVARAGRIWMIVWVALYVLLSLPFVAQRLHASLASSSAAFDAPAGEARPQVIVVLSGGAARYRFGTEQIAVMSVATSLRVLEAARVYRLLDAPMVVASGAGPRGAGSPEVPAMRDGLVAAGVPADRILLEDRSADTRGSALAVRDLLQSRQITKAVLVTSADHMPRAMQAYRAAGVDVVAAPAPALPARALRGWLAFVPDAGALRLSEGCLHEYVGMAYYWIRGWQ